MAKWCKIHKVYIYSHSTLLLLFTIHEYIYSHSTTKFIFKKYINSHLTTYFLFTNIFTQIYEMHSFQHNISFSIFCAPPSRIIGPSSRSIISERNMADEGRTVICRGSSLRASSLFGSRARFILGASGERPREDWGWGELARPRPNPPAAARAQNLARDPNGELARRLKRQNNDQRPEHKFYKG